MLAKELKIGNLKRQREFIKKQLEYLRDHPREDGNTTYRYTGYLFPEVIEYFKKEGFSVLRANNDMLETMNGGNPVNLFIPSMGISLSEDEKEEAEKVEIIKVESDAHQELAEGLKRFIETL